MINQSTQPEPVRVTPSKRPVAAKGSSKTAQLIKMLSRKSGADVGAISAKFGWQPHTTRAALSGLRKAGFDVAKENFGSGKPTRYRIETAPTPQAAAEVTDGK